MSRTSALINLFHAETNIDLVGRMILTAYPIFLFLVLILSPNFSKEAVLLNAVEKQKVQPGIEMLGVKRTEYVDGKRDWKLIADIARYRTSAETLKLTQAKITLYPRAERKSEQIIYAGQIRLDAASKGHENALFEDGVKAILNKEMVVESDVANYSGTKRLIRFPTQVTVTGPGYTIIGGSMDAMVDSNTIEFKDRVESVFKDGITPSGVSSALGGKI